MFNTLFNRLIITITPFLPRRIVWKIAGRYVAGKTSAKALAVVRQLNDKGYSATVDILGEHTHSKSEAAEITREYMNIYDEISEQKLDCNISIKPSHIGQDISNKILQTNVDKLLVKAEETNNFLRIDMESSAVTDNTISLYKNCRRKYKHVGTVFQAYLYRSQSDLEKLTQDGSFNFRLCKGIYKEPPSIAIQRRGKINSNFLKLLRFAFEKEIYVAIATHDLDILKSVYALISELNISTDKFEFQVLYGVPMSGWLEKHLKNNFKVRVYIPFGVDWYAYSIRRLKENPNIAGYILKDLFRR
ncbi:MAG: proline dehydrogenase family protein [Candidatus Marinimicrobia bacterium]|jgi:proline dehydrogenase|nr:proline dehydrogenase family protein [Candidatus Neomarinimicrobiota bacterium]